MLLQRVKENLSVETLVSHPAFGCGTNCYDFPYKRKSPRRRLQGSRGVVQIIEVFVSLFSKSDRVQGRALQKLPDYDITLVLR